MSTRIMVLAVYGLGVFIIGWLAKSKTGRGPEDYFLAGRGLGPLVFLGTMTATNFSAFTVFGASGAGYRDGFAFYPIVGFGTGFMALTFWFLGRRIRSLGLEGGILTPPNLIRRLYSSPGLSALFAVIMILYTLPYIALQPMAAGYALKSLLGLDYFTGAALVTGLIVIYTLRGGLRSVAWTDLLQGSALLALMLLALVVVTHQAGGFVSAGKKIMATHPELFSRPGGRGSYTPAVWFSFILLWFFCDPMFPQLFQRFLTAREERTIRATMIAYPFVCSLAFLLPVTIGLLGRLNHPGLEGKAADGILPLLAADLPGDVLGALVVTCGLAALMSTLDSQLLTLSSIFSQDLYPLFKTGRRNRNSALPGRVAVLVLAGGGLLLAYDPPDTILTIASQTFTGLAVLFPTVLFGTLPRFKSRAGAWASILMGQAALLGCFFKLIPTFGFLPVVPVMAVSFGGYLLAAVIQDRPTQRRWILSVGTKGSLYFVAFAGIFILGMDFWRWGQETELLWGWPLWFYHFWGLSALQTALAWRWSRPRAVLPEARG